MTITTKKNIFYTAIVIIAIVGFINGIAQGCALMSPTAEAIAEMEESVQKAIEYPRVYGEDVITEDMLEKHWTFASTEAMINTWMLNGFMALMLYGMVIIIDFTHRSHPKTENTPVEDNVLEENQEADL
jgi:hypothetical protein